MRSPRGQVQPLVIGFSCFRKLGVTDISLAASVFWLALTFAVQKASTQKAATLGE